MFSFAMLLFFAFTGITLNHTSWFDAQQNTTVVEGDLSTTSSLIDTLKINELFLVEHFRNKHKIKAALTDFIADETECSLSFKGPGYSAEVIIDRVTGQYELITTNSGLVAILNDLHKGRDSGTAWKWLIDISAVLMIAVSLTGFVMIFFLKRKRFSGLALTVIGGVLLLVFYYAFV